MKFCSVGATGVVVNEGLLFLLTEFAGLFYLVSSVMAIEMSILSNFLLNNTWTFRDRKRGSFLGRLGKFNLVAFGGLLINVAILFDVSVAFGVHYLAANFIGIGCAVAWNYLMNLHWTWSQGRLMQS